MFQKHGQHNSQKYIASNGYYTSQHQQYNTLPSNYNGNTWNSHQQKNYQSYPSGMVSSGNTVTPQTGTTTAKISIMDGQDGKNVPFVVKIPKLAPITLSDLKKNVPGRGSSSFRYYIKAYADGQEVWEEFANDMDILPMSGQSLSVRCYKN